jgi:hypothetical protein
MQFQVPQNVMMEDRILGPLTAIQFGIMVIGLMSAFVIFTSTSIPAPVNQGVGIFIALFTVVLAVGKFNDQPMYRFIKYIVLFIFTPKVRVWHKEGMDPKLVKPNSLANSANEIQKIKKVTKNDIARLSVILDSRGKNGVILNPQSLSKHQTGGVNNGEK